MPFVVRDVIVAINDCPGGCSNAGTGCTANTRKMPFENRGDPPPYELVELRGLLEYSLRRVDSRLDPSRVPQDLAEVDFVEQRLKGALEELDLIREQLQK